MNYLGYFMFPLAGTAVAGVFGQETVKNNVIAGNENVTSTMNKIFLKDGKNAFLRKEDDYLHISTGDLFHIKEINGRKIIYYKDVKSNAYGTLPLDEPSLLPLASSLLQAPTCVTLVSLINGFCNSAYIDSDKKRKLKAILEKYIADTQYSIKAGFGRKVANPFRLFEGGASLEELEDYVEQCKKDPNYNGNWWSWNYEEKVKYKMLKDDINEISETLFEAFKDAKKKQEDFSLEVIKELQQNTKYNKLARDILLQANNSVLFQESLYSYYKNNGCNLGMALEDFVRNQIKNHFLFYSQQCAPKGTTPNIVFDSDNISNLNDDYIEGQVERFFKLGDLKKTQDSTLMIDEKNGFVLFNDEGKGNCIFDLNNLEKDLENPCYFATISRMFEKLFAMNDKLNLSSKTVDESDRMKVFLSELYDKVHSFNKENDLEKETISIALLHYVKILSELEVSSRLDIKQRPTIRVSSLDVKKANGEEYTNYMFDITDPIKNTNKTGTILRKGDRIFFKQEPGSIRMEEITLECLLQVLPPIDDLCKENAEAVYVGDVWPMRKMIDDLQSIQHKKDEIAETKKNEIYNSFSNVSVGEREKRNKNNITNLASLIQQKTID